MKYKISYRFILAVGFLFLADLTFSKTPMDSLRFDKTQNYINEIGLYNIYKKKSADVVMLGDSHTHGANWNELLDRNNVVERGVPGDIVEGFLNRIKYVTELKPKVCFIMGGINDIYNWIPVEKIYQKYISLITELKRNGISPVIQAVIYSGKDYGKEWLEQNSPESNPVEVNRSRNAEVEKLNMMLKNFADRNKIDFIDLNSKLSLGKFLRKEFSADDLHLNPAGYKIWGEEVEKILSKYNL